MAVFGIAIKDEAGPFLDKLAGAIDRADYAPVVGEAGVQTLVDHFSKKEKDPAAHKTAARLGAKQTGLFAEFARSTNWQASRDSVLLQVNHAAARQRYKGGTIRPVNRKYLTIPNQSAAYGHMVREFGNALHPMFGRDKKGVVRPIAFAERVQQDGKNKFGRVFFWLVDEVKQDADPSVIPDDKEFLAAAEDAFLSWVDGMEAANG